MLHNYQVKTTFRDGSQVLNSLPKAPNSGIVLSIDNDSLSKASVKIEVNEDYFRDNKMKVYSLLIYSGGKKTTIPCTLDSVSITLDILKRHLQTGIATITLLSPSAEPLCERLIFVQNYDLLNIIISSNKPVYTIREAVNIKLNVKNKADSAVTGHFSVSVTDESKVPVDENNQSNILTNLLLTSDLKGYIEQPNYYFNKISGETLANLDLVMLTHGYRKFEWKRLLNNLYPPVVYQPEKAFEIAGQIKNRFGKPISHGKVTLIAAMGGPILSRESDKKGVFRFTNLVFMDNT